MRKLTNVNMRELKQCNDQIYVKGVADWHLGSKINILDHNFIDEKMNWTKVQIKHTKCVFLRQMVKITYHAESLAEEFN